MRSIKLNIVLKTLVDRAYQSATVSRELLDDVDLSDQIEVPLSAGSILFFHSLIMHGSDANTSPHSRNTALYAYFSPHVRYVPKDGQPKEKTFVVAAGLDNEEELTLKAETR